MNRHPLKSVFTKNPIEGRYFTETMMAASPDLIERCSEVPADEPFIYPLKFYAPRAPGREDFSYFLNVAPDILDAIRDGQGLMVLDVSNEGGAATFDVLDALHARLDSMGIPPSKVALVTQNTVFLDDYREWAAEKGLTDLITIEEYHCFLRLMAVYATDDLIPSGRFQARLDAFEAGEKPRKHAFLSLNFTPRPHRLALMLHLLKQDHLSKGLVSFPGLENRKLNLAGREDKVLRSVPFPDIAELETYLPALAEIGPLTLDVDPFAKSPVVDIGLDEHYSETYLSLVTESGVSTHASHRKARHRRFTEKPFKPMLGFHPFIIVGLPFTLREIRRYGFKTFAPFINEDYDEIEDDKARMEAVLQEIDRVVNLPDAEKVKLRQDLKDVLLHNYMRFGGDLQAHFLNDIERPLVDKLRALAVKVPSAAATVA